MAADIGNPPDVRPDGGGSRERDWWISVDILRPWTDHPRLPLALEGLAMGRERYDLALPGGRRLSRGIFDPDCDLAVLAGLLRTAGGWKTTTVRLNGRPVRPGTARQAAVVFACAGGRQRCVDGSEEERNAYWGCPVVGIRLTGYRKERLLAGERFWFEFFRRGSGNPDHFLLDKAALRGTQELASVCPFYRGETETLLGRLPESIYLGMRVDAALWRLSPSTMSRGGPVMPRHAARFEKWLAGRLAGAGERR